MKKLILPIISVISFGFLYGNTINDLEQLVTMMKDQKAAWFDFENERESAKFDLLKQQHNMIFDKKLDHLKKAEDLVKNGLTPEESHKMLNEKLELAIKAYAEYMKEWETFCKEWEKKGMDLGMKQKAEFEKFIAARAKVSTK